MQKQKVKSRLLFCIGLGELGLLWSSETVNDTIRRVVVSLGVVGELVLL
jgi:hypothetical protein